MQGAHFENARCLQRERSARTERNGTESASERLVNALKVHLKENDEYNVSAR